MMAAGGLLLRRAAGRAGRGLAGGAGAAGGEERMVAAELVEGGVGVLRLDRPKALNALCAPLMRQVLGQLREWDADPAVRAVVLAGKGKCFAAGADIKEMAALDFPEAHTGALLEAWDEMSRMKKPVVGAVHGYALGGGCELAMMCDLLVCSEEAKFGQPEILLGTIPGMGGTQRLTRAVGKALAMDMCLTGRRLSAEEALRSGLVSRVFPTGEHEEGALALAREVAKFSLPVSAMVKECVNSAHELPLSEGLRLEKRQFWSTFALGDRKEGMTAFAEKRAADFQDC